MKKKENEKVWTWNQEGFMKWLAEVSALQTFVGSYDKESSIRRFNQLFKNKPLKRVNVEWHE